MRDVEQVEHAVACGVDAIGMILHADSPRTISVQQAQLIRDVVPSFVSLVGVFVDADRELIEQSIELIGLDILQLHGNETELFAQTLSRPYIKAIRAKSAEQVEHECQQFPTARSLLLDPYVKGQHGGTGQVLEQGLWPDSSRPLILAGGLSADNVAERILHFRPYAVDLNSGLENQSGAKVAELVTKAVNQVSIADARCNER